VQEVYDQSDDRLLAYEIHDIVRDAASLHIIDQMYDSRQFKQVVSNMDLIFAERMHVGVAACSQVVPTVFIKYSLKGQGMAEYVYDGLNNHCVLVDVKDIGDLSTVKIQEILGSRGAMSDCLNRNIPEIRKLALQSLSDLNNVVFS